MTHKQLNIESLQKDIIAYTPSSNSVLHTDASVEEI